VNLLIPISQIRIQAGYDIMWSTGPARVVKNACKQL